MDDTLPLVVPIAAVQDYFQCSICMCDFTTTTITACGHRYCEKCITEWVGRQHKCPCCNHDLTTQQLFKDHQFDSLLSTINAEKTKAEEKYFEQLINAASTSSTEVKDKNMTPVEQVLKEHLKQGLIEHASYFQSLQKSFQTKIAAMEMGTQKAIAELQTHGLSEQEIDQQTQDLFCTLERQKEDLQLELEQCAILVAETYDKYLTSHVPKLHVLPVKISVCAISKKIYIPDVICEPTHSIKDIRDCVEREMFKKHNPVVSWEPDVKFFLFGPFAKCSDCEMDKIISDFLKNGTLIPDVQLLSDGCMFGLQYGMKPGSKILIHGNVKLESDLPKRCFVEVYQKDKGSQKVDYFTCSSCSFKWICRSCMEICHQGHEITPYIMQHQPAWACCYCPKKKKCKIQPVDKQA